LRRNIEGKKREGGKSVVSSRRKRGEEPAPQGHALVADFDVKRTAEPWRNSLRGARRKNV